MLRTKARKVYWSTLDAVCLFGEIIINELKYPALLWIEDKVNCYLPTASTM
jgi:hypothetical protein